MDYDTIKSDLIVSFFKVDAVKFGSFILKSRTTSPVYVDFRGIISSPDLMVLYNSRFSVIFRPHGRKSSVIIRYFPSVRTEIYKHIFTIFPPHGWKLR